MLILIPAYEPDLRLVQLVHALHTQAPGAAVLVVDDGSGPAFDGSSTSRRAPAPRSSVITRTAARAPR